MQGPFINRKRSDALTATEAAILDLWDAGHGSHEIERRTGQSARKISNVLGNLTESNETRCFRRAMAAGSAALLAAQRRLADPS